MKKEYIGPKCIPLLGKVHCVAYKGPRLPDVSACIFALRLRDMAGARCIQRIRGRDREINMELRLACLPG